MTALSILPDNGDAVAETPIAVSRQDPRDLRTRRPEAPGWLACQTGLWQPGAK